MILQIIFPTIVNRTTSKKTMATRFRPSVHQEAYRQFFKSPFVETVSERLLIYL